MTAHSSSSSSSSGSLSSSSSSYSSSPFRAPEQSPTTTVAAKAYKGSKRVRATLEPSDYSASSSSSDASLSSASTTGPVVRPFGGSLGLKADGRVARSAFAPTVLDEELVKESLDGTIRHFAVSTAVRDYVSLPCVRHRVRAGSAHSPALTWVQGHVRTWAWSWAFWATARAVQFSLAFDQGTLFGVAAILMVFLLVSYFVLVDVRPWRFLIGFSVVLTVLLSLVNLVGLSFLANLNQPPWYIVFGTYVVGFVAPLVFVVFPLADVPFYSYFFVLLPLVDVFICVVLKFYLLGPLFFDEYYPLSATFSLARGRIDLSAGFVIVSALSNLIPGCARATFVGLQYRAGYPVRLYGIGNGIFLYGRCETDVAFRSNLHFAIILAGWLLPALAVPITLIVRWW